MNRLRPTTLRIARDETGMGMFEVLVSGLILAVISLGVLKTFDAANAQSGFNKSRGVAANLATEDLERLRGFRASQLTGLNENRDRFVDGVKYTVVSTATWLSDDSGSRSCTSDGKQIEYVKLTSKVTWPAIKTDAQAVSQTTLYAPPKGSFGDQGAMAIQVLDRNGVGVGAVNVTATGTGLPSLAAKTDTLGCAYFPYIATGTYNATIAKTDYIDPNGLSTPVATVGVSAENVTTQQFDFDKGGTIAGTVQTKRSPTDVRAVPSGNVSLTHSQLDTPRTSLALTSAGAFSFATKVFPFTGAYYASPGNCNGVFDASAGTTFGGSPVTVTPGQTVTGVSLRKPSVQVLANGSVAGYTVSNMVIKLTSTVSEGGCSDKTYYGKATSAAASNTSWWLSPSNTADNPGVSYTTADSSVPYGTYNACISARVPAAGFDVYWKSPPGGVALTELNTFDTIPIRNDPYSSSNRSGYGTSAAQVGC